MKKMLRFFPLTILLLSFINSGFAQPGTLDSSFGTNGIAGLGFAESASGQAVIRQTDGKIIVAGYVGYKFVSSKCALMRYLENGQIDSSFGTNGLVVSDFGDENSFSFALAVESQPDGKIVIGGSIFGDTGRWQFLVARYNPDGTLDASFGNNGKVTTDFGPDEDRVYDLGIQSDGRIIAVGSSNEYRAMARYNSNGSPDLSFGTNGTVYDDMRSMIRTITILPDDKFIIASFNWPSAPNYITERFLPTGEPDLTFGNDGSTVNGDYGYRYFTSGTVLDNTGNIFIAADVRSYEDVTYNAVFKLKPNGLPDSSFGTNGKVLIPYAGRMNTVLLQQDQKIVMVCGNSGWNYKVVRFNSNGSIDGSFGTDGYATVGIGAGEEYGSYHSALLQPDGKLIICGGYPYLFQVARVKMEEPVYVSIFKNVAVTEGDTGTTPAQFKISLSKVSPVDVLVNYTTSNIDALAGSDYVAASGVLRIKAGKTSGRVVVSVTGDNSRERNERFALKISNPVNAAIGSFDSAVCTIKNDDASALVALAATQNSSSKSAKPYVFPNPVKDQLFINGLQGGVTYDMQITNAAGLLLLAQKDAGSTIKIATGHLPAGVYYVRISGNGKTESLQFIKQ